MHDLDAPMVTAACCSFINYMRHNNAKEYLILLLTVTKFMLLVRRIEITDVAYMILVNKETHFVFT
jgi:hypothetical protein